MSLNLNGVGLPQNSGGGSTPGVSSIPSDGTAVPGVETATTPLPSALSQTGLSGSGAGNTNLIGSVLQLLASILQVLSMVLTMAGGAGGSSPFTGSLPGSPTGTDTSGGSSTLPTGSDTSGGSYTPPTGSDTSGGSYIPTPTPTDTSGSGGYTPPSAGSVTTEKYPGSGKVQWDKAPAFLKKWQTQIQNAAQKTGMPESLLAAMITDESSGNENAITTNQDPTSTGDDAKDVGLMQVNGKTYKREIQPKHPDLPSDQSARYKADVNLLAGAYYVADLPFSSWQAKLRAFNSGPLHVDPSNPDSIKPDSTGLAPGTVGYPTKILGLATRLENGTLNW
jgi:hypothetical protein